MRSLKYNTLRRLANLLSSESIIYKCTDDRNFDVHKPFLFGAFGISNLDELREIIPKKKNIMLKDLMNSLSRMYERLRQIPRELGIQSALLVPEQASSQTSGRKQKHIELEPKTRIPGLECNRALPENVPFVNNMVIEETEYGVFFIGEFEPNQSTYANIKFFGSFTHPPSITQAQPIIIIHHEPYVPQREGKVIKTDNMAKDQRKLVKASSIVRPDPDKPIRVEFVINGKTVYLTKQEIQAWSDIDKVGMEALVSYLVAASMVKSLENSRFNMKLRKLIAEHPDQGKLKSNKVKLEALGYKMD
nr:hypothetical protein [Tanacetum cinerariifolium]